MEVTKVGTDTVLDFRKLGEYPTPLRGIKIMDVASHQVVWEIRAKKESFEAWTIRLAVGENSALVPESITGAAATVVPAGIGTFSLIPGREYRVEAWNRAGTSTTTFSASKQ